MFEKGTLIDEKYEIVGTIGVGGFGTVFKAIHKQLGRPVAIKVLKTTLLEEADGLPRFEREAKAIDAIKHKHVVALYGYGVWQKAPYMVMEHVEGTSLEQRIKDNGKLDAKEAAGLLAQVFDALAHAHSVGVVHRDLKPSNIMLVDAPHGQQQVKIIDFGLAKLMPGYGILSQKLTETGYALGTCQYMPPEQCLGGKVDQCADIYAAGCILYQCVTGRVPFDADDSLAVMFRHINEHAAPITSTIGNTALAASLQVIVDNCLSKEVSQRYQSAVQVRDLLQAVAKGQTPSVTRLSTKHRPHPASVFFKKNKMPVLSVAALATLLSAGVMFYLTRPTSLPEQQTSSTDLANQLYRTFNNTHIVAVHPLKHEMEKVLSVDAADHKLSAQKRLQLHEWLTVIYCTDGQTEKARKQASKALAARELVPPMLRNPHDECIFANAVWGLGSPPDHDVARAVLSETVKHSELYPRFSSDVIQAKLWLAARIAEDRKFTEADRLIQDCLSGDELGSELEIYANLLTGDLLMMQGKYKAADAQYTKTLTYPQTYSFVPWAGKVRAALCQNDYPLAKTYLKKTVAANNADNKGEANESLSLLGIAISAHDKNYDQCKRSADKLLFSGRPFTWDIDAIRRIDAKLCRSALQSAGYNDIVAMLNDRLK